MEIKWLNAVIDLPSDRFDAAADFWIDVTASTAGEIHPDHPEFVHLNPASGDMHLELQRIDSGLATVHLDLVVERDQIEAATDEAVAAGATLVATPGHSVLATPGGVPFCIVPWSGESTQAPVIDAAHPHAVDQICIDVPHEHFEADVAFWAQLTGWEPNPRRFPEFQSFTQPGSLPVRLLIQQLGADDQGAARAHLDVSAGEHITAVAQRHATAGATVVEAFQYWTLMQDPAGMHYCITGRAPYAF